MLSNQELIQAFKMGDANAFTELVKQNQDYIYTVSYSILKTKEEAQEVTQDTFVKAYKNIHKYNAEAKLRSWLYKIAYRTALDKIRQRKKSVDLEEVTFNKAYVESKHDYNIEKEELYNQLDKAIQFLNPNEASVLRLFYLEEKKVNEIVDSTGLTKSNIKVLLFRARKNLAKVIKERFIEIENYLTS